MASETVSIESPSMFLRRYPARRHSRSLPTCAPVIVVAGEALIDLVVSGDEVVATPGGAPFNVARGCARLGLPTALLATLSGDGFGVRLAGDLARSGVSDALLQRTERLTTLAVAELDPSGGATYRFYVDGTSAP